LKLTNLSVELVPGTVVVSRRRRQTNDYRRSNCKCGTTRYHHYENDAII